MNHIIKKQDIVYLDGDLTLYHNPKLKSTILELMDELQIDSQKKGEIINHLLIKNYNGSFKSMAEDIAKLWGTKVEDMLSEKDLKKLEKAHLNEISWFELYNDSLDFLRELKWMKIKSALASNATDFYRMISRKMFKLDKILDYMYLSCELWYAKLDSSFYKKILEEEGILAKNALMIGDNIKADVLAPKDAWMNAIHIVRKDDSSQLDKFSQHLATNTSEIHKDYPTVNNLEEALKYIKNSK